MRLRRLPILGWLALIGALAPASPVQGQPGCVFEDLLCPGDLLVSDALSGEIVRIRRPGGTPTPVGYVPGSPGGIAVDRYGFVFVSEVFNQVVFRVEPDPASGILGVVALGYPLAAPEDLVFEPPREPAPDRVTELLVAEPTTAEIYRLDPVTGDPGIAVASSDLRFPQGLAYDETSGVLYITDTASSRPSVWKADFQEQALTAVSLGVPQGGSLRSPQDVAIEGERDPQTGEPLSLLVSDSSVPAVFRVDATAEPAANQTRVVQSPQVVVPVGLAILPDGGFAVADFGKQEVMVFAADAGPGDDPVETYSGPHLVGPWRVAVVAGPLASRADFLVADTDTDAHSLYRVYDNSATAGTRELLSSAFVAPTGIAVDGDGSRLVCDAGDAALRRVDSGGSVATVAQGPPLATPNRVVVHRIGDPPATVYFVADRGPEPEPCEPEPCEPEPRVGSILKVTPDGQQEVLEPAEGENYLVEPVALAIDHDGLIVVLNRDAHIENPEERTPLLRVNPVSGNQKRLDLDPELIALIVNPVDLAIDENGDILLADGGDPDQENAPWIWRLDGVSGAARSDYASEEFFHALEGIALDVTRELLVTDSGDPEASIDASVIRIEHTSLSAERVEIGASESWARPNGIALDRIAAPPALADLDEDAVADRFDNCREVANPDQLDADLDGFGNACDYDFDNDCVFDFKDYIIMGQEWGNTNPPGPTRSDVNGDAVVDILDFIRMGQDWSWAWGRAPGPGLLDCTPQ